MVRNEELLVEIEADSGLSCSYVLYNLVKIEEKPSIIEKKEKKLRGMFEILKCVRILLSFLKCGGHF